MIRSEIVIFGAGGHGRSAADVILSNTPSSKLVFVDECARPDEKIFGFEVVKCYIVKNERCFIAIGDNEKRETKYNELSDFHIISIISSRAYVSSRAKIGCGCFVGNYCHIGPEAVIGENSIINTTSIIEHEVKVGSHCHVAPRSTISGRTLIGDHVFIGTGAVVIDKINICSRVRVGAGAVIVDHITEPGTYIGIPAKKISEKWN
jgi:UDP-N-acetylbacillosamine N-acetyltransferase